MNRNSSALLSLLIFLISATAQTKVPDEIRLTTPEAPWTLNIEGKALDINSQGVKPDHRSAYFLMSPSDDGLNISLYIEPADKCKSSDECRDYVLNLGNPAWGKFQDLAKSRVGEFSSFEFYRPEVQSLPLQMFDIYAQYVGSGYWVDLHLSKTEYKRADRVLFENFIKSLKFVPKSHTPVTETDKVFANARSEGEKWLAVWDAGKCKESFRSLSPLSQKRVAEQLWMNYCGEAQKALGQPKSRRLIAESLIKSLPAEPTYSGATVRYQTTFEKKAGVEIVTLVLEKGGNWTVANYSMQ